MTWDPSSLTEPTFYDELDADSIELVSKDAQPFHLEPEGFWPPDAPDVAPSSWGARCTAGVLHDPESESVICMCGLDTQVWPDGLEDRDSPKVSGLPRVEWLPADGTWPGDAAVSAEQILEEVDGVGLDLANGDPFGVDGNAAIAADPHGVGASLDTDSPVGIDDPSEIGEEMRVHNDTLTSGGEDTSLYYRDNWLEVHRGDARDVLAGLKSESVHCVVTSPP